MKFLIVSLCFISLAFCAPQYGGSNNQRQRRKCRNVHDIEYITVNDEECNTQYQQKCSTLYREKCSPYQDEVCRTVQKRQCDNKRRKDCKTDYKYETESYTEPKCEDKYVTVCEKAWFDDGYGGKEWKEDPDNCNELKQSECRDVQLQRQKKIPYEKCEWNTYQDCYNVPDKQCQYVQKQNCKQEPYQDCQRVPHKVCKPIHKQVPKQRTRRVCEGDKDWDNFNNNNNNNNQDYDYDYDDVHGGSSLDIRGQNDPYSASDVSSGFVQNQNNNNNRRRPTSSQGGIGSGVRSQTKDNDVDLRQGEDKEEVDDDRVIFGQ